MIAILDGDIMMYRLCWTVDPTSTIYTVHSHIDKYVTELLDKTGCSHYIGILGINGSANPKYVIAPDYKRGRPTEKPPHWTLVLNYLITKWKFVPIAACETDDAIALCAYHLKDTIVVSADKDLLQIHGKHFIMGVKRKGVVVREDKITTISKEEAELNYYKQLLSGDDVDNVKGIPGIGEKTALKLLKDKTSKEMNQIVIDKYIEIYKDQAADILNVTTALIMINPFNAVKEGWICPIPVEYNLTKETYEY
jgi:DNA polymerase-1